MSQHILRPLHVGISVTDTSRAIDWYGSVLGFQKVSSNYVPPLKAVVTFLRRDDFELELFQCDEIVRFDGVANVSQDNRILGTKHLAFLTSDMDSLTEEFTKKSVQIVLKTEMENNKVMFIADPDGTVIEFIELSQSN